jgi:hypothetical protein
LTFAFAGSCLPSTFAFAPALTFAIPSSAPPSTPTSALLVLRQVLVIIIGISSGIIKPGTLLGWRDGMATPRKHIIWARVGLLHGIIHLGMQ